MSPKSDADFMAASRVAGRYLVCNAQSEAGFGAISAVAVFEMIYVAGFSMSWWGKISIPVGLFLGLTGFMIYPYRETRVMTLAHFFEICLRVPVALAYMLPFGIKGALASIMLFALLAHRGRACPHKHRGYHHDLVHLGRHPRPAPDIATPAATPDELNHPEPDLEEDKVLEVSGKLAPKT